MTLIEKVLAALTAVAPSGRVDPMQAVAIYPVTGNGGQLSGFEMDCRDWGFAFGVAYAIARGRIPSRATTASANGRSSRHARRSRVRVPHGSSPRRVSSLTVPAPRRPCEADGQLGAVA